MVEKLPIGAEAKASITVRGSSVVEDWAIATASPRLNEWQASQNERLPDGAHFEATDTFASKPQGEYSVTRTLKVIEDDSAGS